MKRTLRTHWIQFAGRTLLQEDEYVKNYAGIYGYPELDRNVTGNVSKQIIIPTQERTLDIMPRTAQNIPANESPSARFTRLATHRVNTILRSYKQLGQLGGKSYTSTPDQRKKIETALTDGLSRSLQAMAKGESMQDFRL